MAGHKLTLQPTVLVKHLSPGRALTIAVGRVFFQYDGLTLEEWLPSRISGATRMRFLEFVLFEVAPTSFPLFFV